MSFWSHMTRLHTQHTTHAYLYYYVRVLRLPQQRTTYHMPLSPTAASR
jgi:hypothetical protein